MERDGGGEKEFNSTKLFLCEATVCVGGHMCELTEYVCVCQIVQLAASSTVAPSIKAIACSKKTHCC